LLSIYNDSINFNNMKKLILFLFVTLLLAACRNSKSSVMTFDRMLKTVDSAVLVKYPTSQLYEVETKLVRNAGGEITDTIIVSETKVIYGLSGSTGRTLIVTFDSLNAPIYTTYVDPWLQDVRIKSTKISLKEAIDLLYQTDTVKPTEDFMTLRLPLHLGIEEPLYMFGSDSNFVSVGANTGGIK